MKELYIWFNRTQLSKGFPLQNDFILKSQFDLEQPRKIVSIQQTPYFPL